MRIKKFHEIKIDKKLVYRIKYEYKGDIYFHPIDGLYLRKDDRYVRFNFFGLKMKIHHAKIKFIEEINEWIISTHKSKKKSTKTQ